MAKSIARAASLAARGTEVATRVHDIHDMDAREILDPGVLWGGGRDDAGAEGCGKVCKKGGEDEGEGGEG